MSSKNFGFTLFKIGFLNSKGENLLTIEIRRQNLLDLQGFQLGNIVKDLFKLVDFQNFNHQAQLSSLIKPILKMHSILFRL